MDRKSFVLPVIVVSFVLLLGLTKCGGSNSHNAMGDTTTKLNAAPDIGSANNPSLADTAYQKDSTKLKKKDTVH